MCVRAVAERVMVCVCRMCLAAWRRCRMSRVTCTWRKASGHGRNTSLSYEPRGSTTLPKETQRWLTLSWLSWW